MFTKKLERLISTSIAVAAVLILFYLIWLGHNAFISISDFPEYYAPAKMILAGNGADSYLVAALSALQHQMFSNMGERFVPIYIPPQGLVLFSPLGLFSPTIAFYLWKCLLIVCLIAATVILKRIFYLDYKKTCYLIAGLCLSEMVYESLRIDQLAPILLIVFLGSLYLLQQRQDIKAGLLLSLMICKPQCVLPFLAYLAGVKRWRPIIVFFSVAIALTLIAYILIGKEGFLNYFALLRLPESTEYMRAELMPTLRGQLLRVLPEYSKQILYLCSVVFASVIGISYFYGYKYKDNEHNILLSTLLIIPMALIFSIHCHVYDLLLLVPTVVAIFTNMGSRFTLIFKTLITFGGMLFMVPLSIYIHYDYLLKGGQINIWFIELLILTLAIMTRLTFVSRSAE